MAKVKIPLQLVHALYPENDEHSLGKEEQKQVAAIAKQIIIDVINESLEPKFDALNDEGSIAFYYNLTFPQQISAQIRRLMREYKQPEGLLLFYLLSAGVHKEMYVPYQFTSEQGEHMMHSYLNPISLKPRKEQLVLSDAINDTIEAGGIGMIEGGTGIGKSLTTIANANHIAIKKSQRAVIATNTISNVQQLVKTYETLLQAGIDMVPIRVVFGRNSFVSVDRLLKYLDEENVPDGIDSKIRLWAKTGLSDNREIDSAPPYLIEELLNIFPGAVTSECVLVGDDSNQDPGFIAYKEQFSREDLYPEIVVCTHAMVAIDAKTRVMRINQSEHESSEEIRELKKEISSHIKAVKESSEDAKGILKADIEKLKEIEDNLLYSAYQNNDIGLLPVYQYLFIDEAHLFEETMSRIVSSTISFRSFINDLEALADSGLIPNGKLKEIKKESALIINANQSDKDKGDLLLSPGSEYLHALSRIVSAVKTTRGYSKLPGSIKSNIQTIQYAINKASSPYHHFSLSFSPVRRFPQIISGEINIQPYIRSIWQQVSAAVCISATLYFPKLGGHTCSYFANNLHVPESRLKKYTPITPPWLRNNVEEICLPPVDLKKSMPFVPVGRRQREECPEAREAMHEEWLNTMADQIVKAHNESQGGTLVLMTSFADIRGILARMENLAHPLVTADGKITTEAQRDAYLNALIRGEKPLWLALGGAWTGLDINGKHIGLNDSEISEKDHVISTLIIPKLPFGLNRSLSYHSRLSKSRKQGTIEVMETVIRFKQGIGRLVRLENQPKNKRILILDGRLRMENYKGYLGPIMRVIESYPRVTAIA